MSDDVTETFTLALGGRQIEFRRASLGQILILQRTARRMSAKASEDEQDKGQALTSAMVKTLDFIDTLFVSEDDRQWVEDQMLAGTVDYTDVLKVLGGKDDSDPDDQAPKVVKRAPRKSPKAAPVDLSNKKPATIVPKVTASRGRTKR